MKSFVFHFALLSVLLGAHGRSVPDNVRQFYDSVKSTECVGTHKLKGGFHDTDDGPKEWSYCQSGDGDDSVIYLQGPSTLTNMDIDCDGTGGRRGRCGSSTDTQSETAFKDQVRKYGIKDLNADIHPYVVFGNEGDYSPTFNPQDHGMKPLSVMAVVCGNKLIYGVWGDTNGDDGPPLVGEASLALGTACFGKSVNGNNGHDKTDVLYIAFPGSDAVPGKSADWRAGNYHDFEASIQDLGDRLIQRLTAQ